MNLALHGFLLQVFVSILNFHHGRLLCSAGEPGYLDFDNLPETNFSCQGKVIGGYYADVEAGCQMFHVCTIGQKDEIMDIKFLCLNGTVFDQETRVCERVDEVDCSKSERFYNLNLELYGNNAVTLSLHDGDDEDDLADLPTEDHQPRTTSARPSTTSTTSTTTSRSTTAASGAFQHPAGYPQRYQPQPPFPQVHTSQSKSLYDDKNGGYHHQYIFHNGERHAGNQATSYQLFSNQGGNQIVSSTTAQPSPSPSSPPAPQIHQIRYSSTVGPPPQIIHSEPSTVTPLYHATPSPTIQTLLSGNANPVPAALINPIYHSHGVASTTEQFTAHSNNPRETSDYGDDDGDREQDVRPLEAIQPTNKGKVSKLTISPVPSKQELSRTVVSKTSQTSQQHRIPSGFLPTPATAETTMRSFYPTPRSSPKPSQSSSSSSSSSQSQSVTHHITQHVHVSSPGVAVPQFKAHQITINLPPPDIQRIVQNPSPLLPSQSRVIVTAKASVSDESGRPLNTTQLVTLPLPTIPASYDDYKEGDESFDPFYRDVPKIRKSRRIATENVRKRRSLDRSYLLVYGADGHRDGDLKAIRESESHRNRNDAIDKRDEDAEINGELQGTIRKIIWQDSLLSDQADDTIFVVEPAKNKKVESLEDLYARASKHLGSLKEDEDEEREDEDGKKEEEETSRGRSSSSVENISETTPKLEVETLVQRKMNELRSDLKDGMMPESGDVSAKSANSDEVEASRTDAPTEIILEEETKSSHDATRTNEKIVNNERIAGHLTKDESQKRANSVTNEERQLGVSGETSARESVRNPRGRKPGARRKNSRSRSSSRMSPRGKQQRTKPVEATETVRQKEKEDKTTTTSTTTTTTTTTTTRSPSIMSFEAKADGHIFGEAESQSSKEVDTRAIGQHDSRRLQDSKDKGRTFDHEIARDEMTENLEQRAEEESEEEESTRSTAAQDSSFTEHPESAEGSTEVAHVATEERGSSDEEYSTEYNASAINEGLEETSEEYETSKEYDASTSDGELDNEESSATTPDRISSHESTTSRESEREGDSFYREDENERSSADEETSSIAKHSEEANSEESDEYRDTTETSDENTSLQEEDYTESGSTEDSTEASADYATTSDEYYYTESRENSTEEAEGSTEGVLKFTDELPDYKDDEGTREVSESGEDSVRSVDSTIDAHDYIDDNYEPGNYKETEATVESLDSKGEKSVEIERANENAAAKEVNEKSNGGIDSGVEAENVAEEIASAKAAATTTTPSTTTASTSTTTATTTTTTTTSTTTTTTTTTTTPRPTTIAHRATSPKHLKPTKSRRIYAYVPPTTTPNPVVIKPRFSLLNPKPAKPPRSYNELAPRPLIRRLSLSRKSASTSTTERLSTTESPEATTTVAPPPTTTEFGRSEENALESKLEAADSAARSDRTDKEAQLSSSSSERHSSANSSANADSRLSETKETFTPPPPPPSKSSTLASPVERTTKVLEDIQETTEEIDVATTLPPMTLPPESSREENDETSTEGPPPEEAESTTIIELKSTSRPQDVTETSSPIFSSEHSANRVPTSTTAPPEAEVAASFDATTTASVSLRPSKRTSTIPQKHMGFSCLEKEMYRFYGDARDCRLFHYCSPGFTSRQVLDFRFVCEEGTAFDEVTQSCRHEVTRNRKCRSRNVW